MSRPPNALRLPKRLGPAAQALNRALYELAEDDRRTPCLHPKLSHAWTSEDEAERQRAELACVTCPLIEQCAAAADEIKATAGVWAGKDRTTKPMRTAPERTEQIKRAALKRAEAQRAERDRAEAQRAERERAERERAERERAERERAESSRPRDARGRYVRTGRVVVKRGQPVERHRDTRTGRYIASRSAPQRGGHPV